MNGLLRRWQGDVASDGGSVVVSALAVTLVLATVVGLVASRSLADVSGSAARVVRSQALALAEFGVGAAIVELDAGLAVDLRRAASTQERDLEVEIPDGFDDSAALQIRIRTEEGSEDVAIVVRATVGRAQQGLTASVRSRSTADYLLLTQYEVVDPALLWRPRAECAAERGDAHRSHDCLGSDLDLPVMDGPVHSNDAFTVAPGVAVHSWWTTSHLAPANGRAAPTLWPGAGVGDAEEVAATFGLRHQTQVRFPRSTAAVAADTHVTCRFRGPTLIRFLGQSIRVVSPSSVPVPGEIDDATDPIGCMGSDPHALGGPVEIVLPERVVIEIVRDRRTDCLHHPLGLDLYEDNDRHWWCNGGDAFVWGEFTGARTVLAEDNIQIVWNVHPVESETGPGWSRDDVLGLVAGDSIVLRRTIRPDRRSNFGRNGAFAGAFIAPFGAFPLDAPNALPTTWESPRIVASLAALRGSIGIQNPRLGEVHTGPVRIEGSVAGRFRGLYAWEERTATGALRGSMGYPVDLGYDLRIVGAPPPGMPLIEGGAVRILRVADQS
jgi:hypothetical protein